MNVNHIIFMYSTQKAVSFCGNKAYTNYSGQVHTRYGSLEEIWVDFNQSSPKFIHSHARGTLQRGNNNILLSHEHNMYFMTEMKDSTRLTSEGPTSFVFP